ncbi:MAG: hypothetical protein NWF09_07530 [Candidatus Bathyarchaeota archaeon]|nr:hypothetical protein [Candidatus Bathyarchaeota archaeon]
MPIPRTKIIIPKNLEKEILDFLRINKDKAYTKMEIAAAVNCEEWQADKVLTRLYVKWRPKIGMQRVNGDIYYYAL